MGFFTFLAEKEGFEPSIGSHLRLISSQVHSTTLPPLRKAAKYSDFALKTQVINEFFIMGLGKTRPEDPTKVSKPKP